MLVTKHCTTHNSCPIIKGDHQRSIRINLNVGRHNIHQHATHRHLALPVAVHHGAQVFDKQTFMLFHCTGHNRDHSSSTISLHLYSQSEYCSKYFSACSESPM